MAICLTSTVLNYHLCWVRNATRFNNRRTFLEDESRWTAFVSFAHRITTKIYFALKKKTVSVPVAYNNNDFTARKRNRSVMGNSEKSRLSSHISLYKHRRSVRAATCARYFGRRAANFRSRRTDMERRGLARAF